MLDFVKGPFEQAKHLIVIVVIVAVVAYFLYRAYRKPMVTGDPTEVPPLVDKVTHTLETVKSKIIHPRSDHDITVERQSEPRPPLDSQLNSTSLPINAEQELHKRSSHAKPHD
jgi:hypothetical protein